MRSTARLAARVEEITPFHVVETMERAWAAERAGRRVFHLEAGEPDFGTPAPVVEAVAKAIAGGDVHYTSSLGTLELREAISNYYAERFGVEVARERIVITTGASASLVLAFAATIDPGDEILMADPGYPCNRNILRVCEGKTVWVPASPEQNYQLNADLVTENWDEATKAVLVGSPANPTGSVIDAAVLASILELVADRGGVSFIDEVYNELVYDTPPSTALSSSDDIFVINSFSKQFGMTGWRLGWLVCPEWSLDAIRSLSQNLYISPPMPSQIAGLAAFTPQVWEIVESRRQEFKARRDVLIEGLRALGFKVPRMPQGGFYVYADSSDLSPDSSLLVRDMLDHADVAATGGLDFGHFEAERHVRFSYTTSLENIKGALASLENYFSKRSR
jgi:aspartate/methionine/tyrosine aminotransferase